MRDHAAHVQNRAISIESRGEGGTLRRVDRKGIIQDAWISSLIRGAWSNYRTRAKGLVSVS